MDIFTAPLSPRSSMDSPSLTSSASSTPRIPSAPSTPSLPQQENPSRPVITDDMLFQSTLGLPMPHIPHTDPTTKILPPAPRSDNPAAKRLSSLLSSAKTGMESLVRRSATYLLNDTDESALVIEWRWESTRRNNNEAAQDDNVVIGKDGWVEGWLD